MNTEDISITELFKEYKKVADNEIAAAMLTLAFVVAQTFSGANELDED